MQKNILIVDHDATQRMIYQRVLEANDFRVFAANTIPEGLQQTDHVTLDLVLLDTTLPDTDVFRHLEENSVISNTPVILLAHFGQDKLIQKALDGGAVDFIIKSSVTPNDIVSRIKRFFESEGKGTKKKRQYFVDVHSHRNDAIELIRDFGLNANFACPTCGEERLLALKSAAKKGEFRAQFVCTSCELKKTQAKS